MNWRCAFGIKDTVASSKSKGIAVVFVIAALLTYLAWTYIGFRLLPDLGLPDNEILFSQGFALFASLTIPIGLLATTLPQKRLLRLLTFPGLLLMGFVSSLLIFTVLRDIGVAVAFTMMPELGQQALRWSAQWTVIAAITLTILGLVNAKKTPAIKEFDFPVANLKAGVRGFRIIHLTDVHIGPTIGAKALQAMVKSINSKSPDIVVITGDLVDGKVHELTEAIAPLFDLKSVFGTYFVTGNHEYYSGAEGWIEHLRCNGVKVLMNEHKIINHMGSRLAIAGVTDHTAHQFIPEHRCDPAKALQGIPAGIPTILLAHQPRTAKLVPSEKVSLQLSGHTHGGQFFPWSLAVPLQQPVTSGLSDKYGHLMYVSKGAGYWGPPKRIAAKSEITLITLVSKND